MTAPRSAGMTPAAAVADTSTTPATVAGVNRALRLRGNAERLTRGAGYYYFHSGASMRWPSSSVYVSSVGVFTVAEWLAMRDELAGS